MHWVCWDRRGHKMVRLSGQPIAKWFIYSWGIIDVVSSLCLLLLPKAIFYQHCSVSSLTPKQNTKEKKKRQKGDKRERKRASYQKKGRALNKGQSREKGISWLGRFWVWLYSEQSLRVYWNVFFLFDTFSWWHHYTLLLFFLGRLPFLLLEKNQLGIPVAISSLDFRTKKIVGLPRTAEVVIE